MDKIVYQDETVKMKAAIMLQLHSMISCIKWEREFINRLFLVNVATTSNIEINQINRV